MVFLGGDKCGEKGGNGERMGVRVSDGVAGADLTEKVTSEQRSEGGGGTSHEDIWGGVGGRMC